ncbi:unnamed protein product [Vicia faba]|uniref:Uncharacterized protein n=1 Tax=Vicia faba TaxID=3906 RepID=A0AAV0ZQ93_VICFA|nr:unnamed protein product [Vicia faba]
MVYHVRTLRQHSESIFVVNFSKKKPSYGQINEEERETLIFKTTYLLAKYHGSSAIVAREHQRESEYLKIEQGTILIREYDVPARWFLVSDLLPLPLAYLEIHNSHQLLRRSKSSPISSLIVVLFSVLSFDLNSVNIYEYIHVHKEWLKEE